MISGGVGTTVGIGATELEAVGASSELVFINISGATIMLTVLRGYEMWSWRYWKLEILKLSRMQVMLKEEERFGGSSQS
jgi:hypothetical protein